jgi:DNA-binding IscR family transcriptional regulator
MRGDFSLAVHALVYLDCKKTILSSEQLAVNICTNPVRIRKVMAKLRRPALSAQGKVNRAGIFLKAAPIALTFAAYSRLSTIKS